MREFVSILLLVIMSALASGIPQFLHQREHEQEHALAASHDPRHPAPPADHDESTCPICAVFHAPIAPSPAFTWLVDSGQWVRYISMLAIDQQSQTCPARISCRGPPTHTC